MRRLITAVCFLVVSSPLSAQLAAPNAQGISFAHVHLNVVDIGVHTALWTEQFGSTLR